MIPELRMREREMKKEWIEAVNWVSAEWLSVSQPQGRWNRGREHKHKWSERRNVRRGESLCFGVCVNWAEVGFRYKSNGAFCTFFFFFFFWISARIVHFSRYDRFRPIRLELAWFRANCPELEPRRRESAKNTWNPRGTTRRDAWAATSQERRRVPPRQTQVQHLWCRVRAS